METMIEVTDLVKKYQDQEVLKKISSTFEKGKITGLIGSNGAGKTVMMKCICEFVISTAAAGVGPGGHGRSGNPHIRRAYERVG